MQQQSEAYPDKKKPKIPCIHQEGIIHATAYAELYKHEFSLGFMIHTPVNHCRQLCPQIIHFWKKKIATKWVRLREFWKYQALERSVKFVINPWLADMLFNRHTITCMVRLWRYHTFVERYQLAFISTLNTTYIHVPVYINKCW